MSITSWQFFAFLFVTLAIFSVVPATFRKFVLIAASLCFYVDAGLASALIMAVIIIANYQLMLGTIGAHSEEKRDRLYLASMLFNAVVFCTLKLAFEPAPNVAPTPWSLMGVAIGYPLGLSFIVLLLHGAITDAHSGKFIPDGKFSSFLSFAIFFPYVSAGPVERLNRMEPVLSRPPLPSADDLRAGLSLIALGLVKKIVTANRIKPYVDNIFAGEMPNSMPTMLLAIGLNVVYVYVDFSGYTDVARGAARCFGIDLLINFDKPFSARSVTDFWRRWHISFSNWLRDYLYMPLAFVLRRQRFGAPLSLVITFLICGFWHRAAWTFLLFGLLHGVAMAIETRFGRKVKAESRLISLASAVGAHIYTLAFLGATIILFSSQNLAHAGSIFKRTLKGSLIPHGSELLAYLGPVMFLLIAVSIVVWQLLERWQRRLTYRTMPIFILACAWALLFLGQPDGSSFIYAQF